MINISVTSWQYKRVLQNHESSRVNAQLNELFDINVNLTFAETLKCVQKAMLKGRQHVQSCSGCSRLRSL